MKLEIKSTVLALTLLGSGSLHATLTHSAGLGMDADTAWMMDGQFPYIFENPAAMQGYENNIYFEYYNTVQMGGIFIPVAPKTTLGVFSGTTVSDPDIFNSAEFKSLYHAGAGDPAGIDFGSVPGDATFDALANNIDDSSENTLENRNLEAMVAYDEGRLKYGGSISYAFASRKDSQEVTDDDPTNDPDEKQEVGLFKGELRLSFGMQYAMSGFFNRVDASFFFNKYLLDNYYQTNNGTDTNERASLQAAGAFDVGINAKGVSNVSAKNRLHLHLGYAFLNRSTQSLDETNNPELQSSYSRIGHRIRTGASSEMTLSQQLAIFWGGEFFFETFSNEYTADKTDGTNEDPYLTSVYTLRIPLLIGLQADINESFQMRFGVRHNVINSGDNSKETEQNVQNGTVTSSTVTSRSSFLSAGSSISLGVSYKVMDNLLFEWLTNVAIFKDGPYFISGQSNAMSTAFAVTFNFGDLYR